MQPTRRGFINTALASTLSCATAKTWARPSRVKLKKAVKFEMIDAGTILERFELAKKCGFLGVEADSPSSLNRDEMVKARDKTGIVIHGVIDSIHWTKRDASYFGADTCLLVPGAVLNKETENFDQCWERSTNEIKKVIPLAQKLGVKIAIEVVWNNFLTTPELLIKYVDQFNSPWVGAYFDCSNMIKYGVPSAEWIRRLGKRMLKFDFKGYSLEKKDWVPIGEGSENWPDIVKACEEVGYHSWATAELGRCKENELMEISRKMDKILELN